MRSGRVVVCGAVALVAITGCTDSDRSSSSNPTDDIRPANELQEEYGLHCGTYQQIEIDPGRVPEHLRDLIPLATKWGVGDDVIRLDCEDKATEEERRQFQAALTGRTAEVEAWLDSGPDGLHPNEEAGVFMYMLLALDEMGLWPDPPSTQ